MRALTIDNRPRIESVVGFLNDLFALRQRHDNKKFWYRGHASGAYQLVPTIGRRGEYAGRTLTYSPHVEWELLHRFRRRTYLEFGRLLSAGEALFVARHHGLPTRLLDWTANALFGLYFACRERPTTAAKLWGMKRFNDLVEQLDALALARCDDERTLLSLLDGGIAVTSQSRGRFKIVEPLYNSPRLRAQDGAFTVHDTPGCPLDRYAGRHLEDNDLDIECLFAWDIAADKKQTLVKELSGLGVTDRMVFPDLDGVARSLWETEVLWRGTDDETLV
jgi:FRG domain